MKDLSLLLNHGKVMSPTGTFKGTPLNVFPGARALDLSAAAQYTGYYNLTGVPDTNISPQGRGFS